MPVWNEGCIAGVYVVKECMHDCHEKGLGLKFRSSFVGCRPDVWFVTVTQALVWMTDPRPAKDLNTLEAWKCEKKENLPPPPCSLPNSCAVPFKPPEANFSATRQVLVYREYEGTLRKVAVLAEALGTYYFGGCQKLRMPQ